MPSRCELDASGFTAIILGHHRALICARGKSQYVIRGLSRREKGIENIHLGEPGDARKLLHPFSHLYQANWYRASMVIEHIFKAVLSSTNCLNSQEDSGLRELYLKSKNESYRETKHGGRVRDCKAVP
jgi:hypothetical protein